MKVMCKDISDRLSKDEFLYSGLVVGHIYDVFAFHLWEGEFDFLLMNELNRRLIVSGKFLNIISSIIPARWFFDMHFRDNGTLEAFWGYHEFVHNRQHYLDLIDTNPEAISILNKEKKIRTDIIEKYDSVRILIDFKYERIPLGSFGIVDDVIGGDDDLFAVTFYRDDGTQFPKTIVPRAYIALDMKVD